MKISLKLLSEKTQPQNHHHNHHAPPPPLLLRAKIPITIFNLPFLSHFSTTTTRPSDLSLSLSTAFPSGPSLKLSYAAATSAAAAPPFTLTLKSGTGLFGSPNNSPLVISAHFSFNPNNNSSNPNPTFSLLLKPQFGSFSLRKSTTSSVTSGNATNLVADFDSNSNSNSLGFVPLERPSKIRDVSEVKIDKESIFQGIKLGARTVMPVGKRVALSCRWWVNFPKDDMMPVLRINKIGIQRVDDVLKKDNVVDDDDKKKKSVENGGETEMLKGMCLWMKRELDGLRSVNREIKRDLEEMKMGGLCRNGNGGGRAFRDEGVRKKVVAGGGERCSSGFEEWRSKRNGVKEENGKKEEMKMNGGSLAIDVENELQRAIMAASAGAAS